MNVYVLLLVLAFLVILAMPVIFLQPQEEASLKVTSENGSQSVIMLEVADDSNERREGLMFRGGLARDRGMLFIFPEEQNLSFWMKNTLIPLDMIFIDSEFRIVNIAEAEPCKVDVCPVYTSGAPAKYVIEVNLGLSKELGLEEGDTLNLSF